MPAAVVLKMPVSVLNVHQLLASSLVHLGRCSTAPSSVSPQHISPKAAAPSLLGVETQHSGFRTLFRRNADKW